jgi:hypothetical protein
MARRRRINVVFTGLVRNVEMFERSLSDMRGIEGVGDIVISTWLKEALDHRAILAKFRRDYGVKVTVRPEPTEMDFEHLHGAHQSIALFHGLRGFDNDDHVLKTRSDCYVDPESIRYLLEKDTELNNPCAKSLNIFDNKISIYRASAKTPFYIDDKIFFGKCCDLRKTATVDMSFYYNYFVEGVRAHYMRWAHPFLQQFKIFDTFFRCGEILMGHSTGHGAYFPTYTIDMLEYLFGRREFVELMMLYYVMVDMFFCTDWGKEDFLHLKAFDSFPSPIVVTAGKTLEQMTLTDLDPLTYGVSALFRSAVSGDLPASDAGHMFGEARRTILNMKDIRDVGAGTDYVRFWDEVAEQAAALCGMDKLLADGKRFLVERQYHPAFECFTRAHTATQKNSEAMYLMALCYVHSGQLSDAIKYLRRSINVGEEYDSPAGILLNELMSGNVTVQPLQ